MMNPPKILIVDNKPENLKAFTALLEDFNVDVGKANNGEEALEISLNEDLALIVFDTQISGMDSYEFASCLFSNDITKHTPIVFIVDTHNGKKYQIKDYGDGIVDFIEKPINETFLLAKVSIFLKMDQQKKALEYDKRKLEVSFNTISDPVLTVCNNELTYLNRSAQKLAKEFGHVGKCENLSELFSFSPDNLINIQDMLNSLSEKNIDDSDSIEITFESYELKKRYVCEFKAVLLENENSDNKEFMLFFHDVSSIRKLSDELVYQALHDPLTSIPNRAAYEERMDFEFKAATRSNQSLVLMMIDIDHFKLFNDNYGHDVGDEALKLVAQALANEVPRDTDFVARSGGEEFVVILPATDFKGAIQVSERIRIAVEDLKIKHEYSNIHEVLTVSIGVTILQNDTLEAEDLFRQADQALYKAKAEGRNRYVVFHE